MDKINLENFIENYSSIDFDKIKFDWNGKHGDEFKDNNLIFRKELVEYIIPNLKSVNQELIRDLYIELSKLAKEAWGAPKYFNLLGQELILRDYKKYFLDYLEGASKSMDTYLSSGQIKIPKRLAIEITEFIKDRILHEKDEKIINFLKSGASLARFQWLSENGN